MQFRTLVNNPPGWLRYPNTPKQPKHNSIVLSSRIRLARNLSTGSFPGWAKKPERIDIMQQLLHPLRNLSEMERGFCKKQNLLERPQKLFLVERHLISREQAARSEGCAIVINRPQTLSIMVNEEDHLRIQAVHAGLSLQQAHQTLTHIEDQLEDQLDFAYHPRLGYLTACPTNLGTGMRASVMLHLPGLVLSDQIRQTLNGITRLSFAVRGYYGEGTESLGNIFQISNQSTLGQTEEEIITNLQRIAQAVITHESRARQKLLEDDPTMLKDRIGRAYGLLLHSHIINSREALTLLSYLRLGCELEFFPPQTVQLCDTLLMAIQPAHLQIQAQKELNPEERDTIRAEILRQNLQNLPTPVINNDRILNQDHST